MLRVYVGVIVVLLLLMVASGTTALIKRRIPPTLPGSLMVETFIAAILCIWGASLLFFGQTP